MADKRDIDDGQGDRSGDAPVDFSPFGGADWRDFLKKVPGGKPAGGEHLPQLEVRRDDVVAGKPGSPEPGKMVGAGDLLSLYNRYKDSIDRDKDGFITKSELNSAQEIITGERDMLAFSDGNPKIWEKDLKANGSRFAMLVGTLRINFDELESLSNDEFGFESRISRADIEAFDKMQAAVLPSDKVAESMAGISDATFNKIDHDSDGFLSEKELDRVIDDRSFNEADRHIFRVMRERVGDVEEASNDEWLDENDGITRADLKAYLASRQESDEFKLAFDVDWSLKSYSGILNRMYPAQQADTFGGFGPEGEDLTRPGRVEDLASDRNSGARFKNTLLGGWLTGIGVVGAALGAGPIGWLAAGSAAIYSIVDTRRQYHQHEADVRRQRYEMWRDLMKGR